MENKRLLFTIACVVFLLGSFYAQELMYRDYLGDGSYLDGMEG